MKLMFDLNVVLDVFENRLPHKDTCVANQKIDWLLTHFDVVSADKALFVRARSLPFDDFEDSVVAVLADVSGCDYIVTRNEPDFEHSPVVAITPENFVKRYVVAHHQENSE